jgi:hypothetical protein
MNLAGRRLGEYADEIGKIGGISIFDLARALGPLSRDEISSGNHWLASQNFIDFI